MCAEALLQMLVSQGCSAELAAIAGQQGATLAPALAAVLHSIIAPLSRMRRACPDCLC